MRVAVNLLLLVVIVTGSWLVWRAIPVIPPYEYYEVLATIPNPKLPPPSTQNLNQYMWCSFVHQITVTCSLAEPVPDGDLIIVNFYCTSRSERCEVEIVDYKKAAP
jgi:hypothetical protein